MLKKITLKNYMSHALTVIEPAAGLTVLIGPNNCGKSAVVSALQTLCGNEKGSYMVRHNEKDCQVIVETDDGHTIEWFRKKGVPGYVLDGEPVHRVKKDILEQIQDVLRLPKVIPTDAPDAAERREAFDIHFATQKAPIFLLDEPPSRAALFFASASDAALLVEMQKRHRTKVMEASREKTRLERELHAADALLAALDPVAELNKSIAEAERAYETIVSAERETEKLRQLVEHLETQSEIHGRCQSAVELIRALTPPPPLPDTGALTVVLESLAHYHDARDTWTAQSQALRAITPPPRLGDAAALAWLCQHLEEQERAHAVNAGRAEQLSILDEPPEFGDAAKLAHLTEELEAAQRRFAAHVQARDVLKVLRVLPAEQETRALVELLESRAQLEARARDAAQEAKDLEAERQGVMNEIRAWASSNPTCPTCGGAVDAESLLSRREHTHAK